MIDPLLGTASITAAFFAGILALLAPCCVTFLLPAYLASGVQHGRWQLVRMTTIFSAGLAAVLLPVAWGVAGLAQLVPQFHRELFFVGGVLLLGLGTVALTGRWSLPMPQAPRARGRGAAATFALGAFSGVASSCCAPVLAGVLALSIVAPTWWVAMAVGLAYVFGMVFPLLLVAALGQRFDLLSHPALRARRLEIGLASWRTTVLSTNLFSALLLWAMGLFVLWLGASGETAYAPPVLQDAYLWLRGVFDRVTERLAGAGPFVVALLAALLAALLLRAGRRRSAGVAASNDPVCGMPVAVSVDTPRAEHEGTTYHFCCRRCRDAFVRDPGAFVESPLATSVP